MGRAQHGEDRPERVLPGMKKEPAASTCARSPRARGLPLAAPPVRSASPRPTARYEALLADPEIEAIYNPLPNHLHVPLTLQAAAGRQARAVREADRDERRRGRTARGRARRTVLIAEAFMVRYHPQWHARPRARARGSHRHVRAVQAFFSYFNDDPANIRNQRRHRRRRRSTTSAATPMVAGRYFFGCEPARVVALIDRDPAFRTDRLTSGLARLRRRPAPRLHRLDAGRAAPAGRSSAGRGAASRSNSLQRAAGRDRRRISIDDAARSTAAASQPRRSRRRPVHAAGRRLLPRRARRDPAGLRLRDAIANMRVIDALFRSETQRPLGGDRLSP